MVSPTKMSDSEHCSMTVRKIKNGYLVSKSMSKGDKYNYEDEYHERKPNIDVFSIPSVSPRNKSGKVNSDSLRLAAGNKKVRST